MTEGGGVSAARPSPPRRAPPERQNNLTDPDNPLMLRLDAKSHRQADDAHAEVCVEGPLLVLAVGLVATSADVPSFAATVLALRQTTGLSSPCWP